MNMLRKLCAFLAMTLFLSACDDLSLTGDKGKFYYSNPSSDTVVFTLDNQRYELEPNQTGLVILPAGSHTLENSQGEATSFMVFEHNSGGIINPNNFMYYTFAEYYSSDGVQRKIDSDENPLIINGHEVHLPIKSSNAKIIDANIFHCRYPVGVDFPRLEARNHAKHADEYIQSKCFDKSELINYFAQRHQIDLSPKMPDDENINSSTIDFIYQLPDVVFLDDEVQFIAEQLMNTVGELKITDDLSVHSKINSQLYQLVVELSSAHAKESLIDADFENIKYSNFIDNINMIMNYGIFVK